MFFCWFYQNSRAYLSGLKLWHLCSFFNQLEIWKKSPTNVFLLLFNFSFWSVCFLLNLTWAMMLCKNLGSSVSCEVHECCLPPSHMWNRVHSDLLGRLWTHRSFHRLLSYIAICQLWTGLFFLTQNMKTEEPSSCDLLLLRGKKEKNVYVFVLKGHNVKINISLWEKSKKKKKSQMFGYSLSNVLFSLLWKSW